MTPTKKNMVRIHWFLGLAMLCGVAYAGSPKFQPVQALPVYGQECAACHLAYPPALLPAASWARVMGSLSRHYGADASLEPEQVQEIGRWLQSEAGTGRKVGSAPPQDRITRSDWFVREHRKLAPAVWRLPSVQSPAQCNACHTRANQGSFNERELHRPAGMNGGFQ